MKALRLLCAALTFALAVGAPHRARAELSGEVLPLPLPPRAAATVLEIHGAIGPATSRYVMNGLATAQARGAALVVIELDTPGGLDSSMRDIIQAILASRVPVVSYVSPAGARAASAGTYILYASHVAAMAPATNLGAATPVSIGGERDAPAAPLPGVPAAPNGKATAPAPDSGGAMEHKVLNDATAYIRSLAELRGRNVEWAEQAVRGAASLSATQALQQHVIDVIAQDLPDLLTRIDGREVHIGGHATTLATRGLRLDYLRPDWRVQLLAVITNPTVAYGLMLIGIWGLLLEGYNPGVVLPGVVGSICLVVALFAFQVLSVNYAGLALVVIGVGLIVAEFFLPTYGSLGIGGLIAFVIGSLILFDSDVPGLRVGRGLIGAIATVGALSIAGIVWLASRSRLRPVETGAPGMIGASAEVVGEFPGHGRVRYGGELWRAVSDAPLRPGELTRIVRVEGLTLWVEPQ